MEHKRTIEEIDLIPDAMLSNCGWVFLIHYTESGNVYYEKWSGDDPRNREAAFMPIDDFIKQYNRGKNAIELVQ